MNDAAAAEIELRKITNYLLKISAHCSLEKMEREAYRLHEKFKASFPDKVVFFHRRILDVKRLMFIDSMSEEEILTLYIDYKKFGFDNLSHQLSSLYFLHKFATNLEFKSQIESVIIELIRDHQGDAAIDLELSWMPDLVQKALSARKSD